jgi:hypothetical protein
LTTRGPEKWLPFAFTTSKPNGAIMTKKNYPSDWDLDKGLDNLGEGLGGHGHTKAGLSEASMFSVCLTMPGASAGTVNRDIVLPFKAEVCGLSYILTNKGTTSTTITISVAGTQVGTTGALTSTGSDGLSFNDERRSIRVAEAGSTIRVATTEVGGGTSAGSIFVLLRRLPVGY